MVNQEEYDIEDIANLDEAKYESGGKHEEEEEEEEDSVKKMKKKKCEEETEFSEGTIAADSLKTHGVQGKADAMSTLLGHMNSMSKGDAVDFFHKVMSQFGPNKDYGVDDKSAHNQSSIDMKPSHAVASTAPKTADAMPKIDSKNHWAEDVDSLFDGQDLSEEFKEKTVTIFEAAINARVISEVARLEEEFEIVLNEKIQEVSEEMNTKLDAYLDYCVENWMRENEVAIESTLRNEIMEEFLDGLKNLFAEHYIDVPEEKVSVIEALADKVDTLEQKLDEAITRNAELEEVITEEVKQDIFEKIASDLALTQQEKFRSLSEGIEFNGDFDVYAKKLKIVKENYFGSETVHTSNINEETFEGNLNESTSSYDPVVNRYVQALSRTVKK